MGIYLEDKLGWRNQGGVKSAVCDSLVFGGCAAFGTNFARAFPKSIRGFTGAAIAAFGAILMGIYLEDKLGWLNRGGVRSAACCSLFFGGCAAFGTNFARTFPSVFLDSLEPPSQRSALS